MKKDKRNKSESRQCKFGGGGEINLNLGWWQDGLDETYLKGIVLFFYLFLGFRRWARLLRFKRWASLVGFFLLFFDFD